MYIYYKIYKSMRRGRIYGEKNMRNSRTKTQTKLRNYIKLTAGALLLAITFVLVFAGTLSGAFGIESDLQQNGIIENNVASAASSRDGQQIDVISTNADDPIYESTKSNVKLTTEGVEIAKQYNVGGNPGNATLLTNFYQNYEVDGVDIRWVSYEYLFTTYQEGFGLSDLNKNKAEDKAFVYWLEFKFDEKIIAAIRNIGVSFYASATGRFDHGKNDEFSFAVNYIGTHSSPTHTIVGPNRSGDNASWSDSFTNFAARGGWFNDNEKTINLGENKFSQTYRLSENATGIRLIFAVIGDDYLEGGFRNISCKLFLGNGSIPITVSPSNAGTVSNTELSGFSNIEDTKTVSFKSANDPYYFSNWSYKDQSGNINTNSNASLTAKPYYSDVTAQYEEIPFVFNGTSYDTYNPITKLVVLENTENYMSSTIGGYNTSIEYKNTAGVTIPQPGAKGNYTATITVKKGGVVRGTRTVEFEVVEGDFGKIQGGTGKWGSATNPYVISNETHLKNLSAIVNGRDALNSIVGSNNNSVTAEDVVATDKTYKDCYFVVAADLGTADAQIALVPIGKDDTHHFAGTIFGGNDSDANNRTMRTISLNIQSSGVSNVGLFGYVKGATISHLTTAGSIAGGAAVGGLVGYADGVTISNCRNNASISGKSFIGGIVGKATNATINASHNTNTIQGSSTNVGGILGGSDTADNNILITSCYNTAKLSGIDNVGGITGRFAKNGDKDVKISNCYNLGEVFGTADSIGGIVGFSENGCVVEYCYNKAKITGSYALGGIVGSIRNGGSISILYCYADFTDEQKQLNATNPNSATGGVAGGIVSGCFAGTNTANITVENSWAIYNYSSVKYTDCKKQFDCITDFAVAPLFFDGTNYVDKTWTDILTVNINAFQILGETESGKFLALHDGSNKSTLPNKTVIGKEKNSTGSLAKTDLVVNFIVYYNANTKQNVVAELKDIKIDAAAVDYNATEQYVVDNTQLPTTVNTHYFKQSFYFDQNGGGNATLGKTNAGTYKVYSDVWIRANNTDYLVGRKESTWTIKKLKFAIGNNQFFYGQDIENAIKNQIVIKNQSNVSVPKGAYTVVFGFNDTEHNFYGSIDIDQNQKEFSVAKTIISIYDSSNTLINDNFDINGFSVIVKAGDFGVQNNGINKSNIENNPWGSESNPYIIGTRDQLVTLSNIVRGATNATNSWYTSDVYKYVKGTIASYGGAYFKLARSIASIGNITPIGTSSNVFSATFDGNKNNLSGLNISVAGNNVGLFGYISGATIKYLTVNGSVKGSSNVGGVVGYALNSTIENVTNNASISSTYKDAPYEIKQFDAHPYDSTTQAVSKVNDGDLNSKYYSAKKGAMSFIVQNTTLAYIFGFAITNADDTNNTAEIQKRTPQSVKIWGSNNDFTRGDYDTGGGNTTVPNEWGWEVVYDSTLAMPSTNSYRKEFFSGFKLRNYKYYYIYVKAADNYSTLQFAEFDLLTTNSQNVGGVVGYANGTNIKNATNNASVEGDTSVGGIVGYADSTSRMYGTIVNSGNITANSMVGGVSGENHGFWCDTNSNYGTFKNSGSINGRNGATVGGVTAFADKEMCNAENTGNVIGGNAVGGVAGRVQAPIKNSYNSGEIVGTNPTAQGEISGTPTGVFVGGITGYTTVNGTISNCYNKGHIAAHSASGDYINNGDYVGGIVGFAQAKVEYCANIGGLIEGNNFIGGIVGSALDNTNIDYCYDVQGQRKFRWDGCNHGSITGSGGNVTNSWAINEKQAQTTANNPNPVVSTKGYRLTTAFAVTPQVDLQNTTNQKWEDILSSKINGFKVVGSVAKNEFFCSDNGSDTNTKYVKPSKTEGFAGDNGDVTAWYSATIESNIRVRVQNITLPTIGSKEYDGLAHGFGHTTYPNTANGAAANNPIVYTTEFLYVGTTYKENLNVSPTNVDVYNTTVTIKIDGQIVGVKKGDTVTITERLLKVSNVWTSASEHVAGDTSNVYIFHYNTQHQGIIENGISVASVHGEFAIPQDVYTIGGYVETKQAHNDTTHTRTFTLNDIRNYKIENKYSQYDDFSPNTVLTEDTSDRGISEATAGDTIVVTYTWKIVPFDLAANISNVWFGGTTNLIVGNQGIANVNVGNQSYADKRFYPLQSEQNGVQKVLVYAQYNYAADKFVLYVKYNNGTVAVLTQGTEYTLSALDAPTVENPAPLNTSVTASGKGNFDGDITKYYTAMFSDFGWKDGKTPEDNDWGGSADNPYVISKPEHLLRLSQIVNGGTAWNSINTTDNALCIAPQTTAKATSRDYKDAYFLVTVDIDMSGYISTDGVYNFLPIGTRSTQNQTELPFSATFDGGDNTITYVYNVGSFYNVDGARKNYVGLFGYLNGATISNLKVASNGGLSITDNGGIVGIEYVGGIAGYAVDSTLYNSVLAYGGWVRGETYVGGIVGYGERITIVSSEAVSSANVGGETYVGGIVGKWIVSNQSQIGGSVAGQRYVTPADQIDVMGIKYVGGIAGWMDTSSCATTISYAPQLNNNGKDGNFIVVGGIEYVGALFGAFIGNGYHQNATNDKYTAIVIDKDASDNFKVGNVKVILQKLNEQSASGNAKVVGGLVGYAEGVGILFNTDWTTSNVTLDTGNYTPSFIGGIAGVLGKNATIEAKYQLKDDGTFLTGGTHTITHSVPDEQKTFGTAAKPLGSFVGGIVGYVSSQAGVYWETGTTIFGNGISLVNLATIYATSYAGGIFGALGDLSTSVAQTFENDTNSILYNVLTTGVRSGNASTTLGLAPTVSGNGITAQGRLVNNASISVSGSYVGGIAGYGGAKVRFVLRNTPQDSAIDVSKLNIYSGGSDIFINGSYAGGIAGYLVDNLEHDLQYIVVKARFNTNNQSATRVGGLVGYMGSGNVQNCVVTNGGSSAITASTDTYQGSEYVGGLVGETQNATIRNSVSTGFNLEKTSNTKGGLLGGGTNPTIDSSWTFYIAKKRTNFAKNATPNGAYYATVSQSPYGKYILVDEGLINATEASYPAFVSLCGFVGLLTNANVEGTLEFAVKVPNKTLNSNYENTQLAFYNASGSDTVTDNVDSFSKFENNNNTLTIALDMASGNSMQICVVGIEFVNVPQKNDTDTDKTTVVEGKYRKPSNSDKYIVHVTTANFNSERQITKIVATVYFECNGNLPVVIGSAYDDKRNIGGYDETFTPGSSTNPYTISSQKEWNDFAYSVYSGAKDYAGEYVKLLTNITINNTTAHMGTASSSTPLNFSTECTPNNNSDDIKNAKSNLGYNLAGNISQGSSAVNRIYFGTSTTLSTTTPSFKGTFDGNGNTIDIQYTSGGYHRISVFPNAANATFKNLTINGTIAAGTNTSNSGYDIAAFVGKPFGAITFTNCTAAVDIQGLRVIAGFSGYSSSTSPITLIGCVNKGDITSFEGSKWNKSTGQNLGYPDDYQYGTGGLIAYATNDITIDSCLNTGNVVGQTKVGGLVGRVTAFTTIKNSANTGDITGEEVNPYISNDDKKQAGNAWSRVGGLVGEASKTATLKMYACYNTGAIRGKSNVAGGLVGILGTIPSNEKPHSTEANNTSTIAYCYNTGEVTIGWKKFSGITMVGLSGYNFNGTDAGGLVGVAVKLNIEYSYNTGDIHGYGGVGNLFTWQVRNGGILAEACTKASNCSISINNCYSTGRIYIEENETNSDTRYSADIVGYLDEDGGDNNDGNSKVRVANCYGIANNIVSRKDSAVVYYSGWNSRSGNVKYVRTGTTLNSLSDLTAIMRSDGSVKPRAFYYANNQNNEVELWNASTATIKDGAQNTTAYKNGTLGGYVYVYGGLPQLAVFAVDTYNGLSMNSQNYGQDIYGEYREQKAGEEYSPYVIRDGIDLMGVQTLVGLGYTFEDKYIEFANGSNNITLDKNLSSDIAKAINMPISNSTSTKIADSENAYKSLGKDNTYHIGKSYHLFKLSAVCYDDNNIAQNTAYGYWLSSNHYYNGAYGNKEGAYKNYATFKTQNILTIGRNGNVFKGSISGKQENNANTVINNLRITSGQTIGGAYGGLFGHVENAYIGYIEVGGESNIWAYSSDNQQIAATGAIAGYVTGDSIIEHCAVSGTTAIGAYGKNDNTHIASDITYAGGIVGLTDPKQGSEYKAGISAIIKGCTVNISTTTGDRAAFAGIIQACKSNIGGVLGYVGGDAGASGKGNTVRIEGCEVQKAAIQAASSANTSSQIGGILGYGSEFVAAFITGCKVGNGEDTVTIKGEHSLGGIAGGMSNAKGGYIDSCIVGEKASIERINQGGGNISENPKHGTAIGGLVGFTQDSKDDTSPLTTTFSGTSAFGGTITVSVESTNKSQDSDAKISCIGGIVGDMGSGASFASGSDVTVGGTIDIKNSQGDWLAAANVGGVVGRTNKATFIGKFNVAPNMSTENAENVGGFIGKNIGTVYILADTTDKLENTTVDALNGTNITIGGKIKGTSEVGGFIGVNNSGSTLNIGSNIANAKAYKSGTLKITITASVTGSHDNVGGIVGKNEGVSGQDDYAIVDIVKGTIKQNGAIKGANNVGGIIGLNDGLLTTGGGAADTTIGGVTLSEEQQNEIKNLSINNTGSVTGTGDYVGGVVGKLDSPATLSTEDSGKGAIAGTFTNSGDVSGGKFVGGSLGYVGKNVTITAKGSDTVFTNTGTVTATGYYAGGSIGALVGKIEGVDNGHTVNFKNTGTVTATGFVGGSIGVLAGPVKYAQFVNSSGNLSIAAVNAVGGSVGFIGVPTPLETILTGVGITLADDYVKVENTHFEASGELTANPDSNAISVAKDAATNKSTGWGGVGGAIGVIGKNVRWGTEQNKNTYYANGNVTANGINNVGGIVGIILAENVNISNMLAYNTTVKGGENVGGIVGATDGIGTVITSAYAIEGTFTGSKNVGGIIGLAKTDTDASTSYWVKGYANAILAGTDVKNLQQDLGKFETIIEYVGEQPIVFTEDFCKMYTPKTYYDDYPGTHTYNGKTITLGENVEQLTWYDYFKDKLGETSAQIKNGAWVKPIANAPTYTTGANNTGWYFVYATDKTIGTIKAEHSTNANLQYWKRIADAYTSSERNEGRDDNVKNPLASDIVLGNGAPQKSTLYATATAAGTESGYYLYMATSGKSRPSATNQDNKFYIQTLTTNADALAENVAVYYRTISKGKALTFNGYLRYAPVGITASEGETVSYIKNPETATGKPNSYCYSADTTTAGGQGTDGAQTNPGSFHSQVNIYYFDSEGKPHVVGGVAIGWTINKRDLNQGSELRINSNTREYGTDNTGDNHDVVLKIANIAPGAGEKAGFVIEIKSDNETIATFTWNGTSFTGLTANAGKYVVNDITISAAGESNSQNNLSDTDLLYNVNEPGDKALREFSCYIDFKHAKKYDIEVKPSTAIAPNNNKQWAELYDLSLTGSFTVSKKELKITGEGTVSPTFNGENHGYRWKVSGIVTNYGDTIAVLAAFSPQVCAYVNNAEHSKALYMGPTSLQTGKVTIDGVAGVNFEVSSNPTAIDVSANNEGSYYVKFATTEAGNYTLKLVNGDQNKKETNHFGIAQNTFTFTWNGVNGKHVYNGTKKGEITLTISTTVALTNLKEFIDNYFDMTMQNGTVTYSDNKAYVTFTTDVNAGEYYAKVSRKTNTFVNNNLHNCAYPSELKTNTQVKKLYKIDKRNLTLTLEGDGTYIYNTEHQGLTTVNVNARSGDVGIISGDSVKVSVVVTRNGEAYYTYSVSGVNASAKSAGVNTINHGVYVATASDGGNSNYDIATDTANWTINKKELKLSGLTGGEKVYDGTAHTPTLKVNGDEVTNGTIPWGNDTISIKFSATLEGDSAQKESLVNVGKYSIKIGGTSGNAIAVSPAKRPAGSGEVDTSDNYTISGADSTTYEIKPRQIKLTWESIDSFVFSNADQGLKVTGISGVDGNGSLKLISSDITTARITGYGGKDTIVLSLSGSIKHVNDPKSHMTASITDITGTNADGSQPIIGNYEIVEGSESGEFTITPSVVSIKFNAPNATLTKVYDGNRTVPTSQINDSYFSWSATGHNPTRNPFKVTAQYDNKNVGDKKAVTFSYTFTDPTNVGDYVVGTVDGSAYTVGQITPAHIKVALDKLRSGKATRTYTDDEFYGGAEGATGNGRSKTYRTGEGFTVSGVLGSDNINVVARYQEADHTRNSNSGNYFDFSKYVNDVYKDADGTFKKASAGKYFKKLVFTMTGTDAANYTFNVYDSSAEGGNKYSESDSTAAAIQSVTVYDSRDSKNKNASGAASIQIEITVKSVRVEYSDTAQSYANDDNTYNTNWKPITGTNKDMDKADAKIKVSNGWMYADGKDHTAEEGYTKREYRGYTTIRGSQNSERLGAKVDPTNGMDLNYRLSNQPTLTIAYFVSTGDEYEINSLARLLIASFYYTASQNPGNLEIIKIVSSGYKWVSVVSADDYDKGEFELPQDTPITDSKATTWDEYFTELEAKGYSVFFNIEANAQDNIPANTWGYYATTTSESSTIPTSYKLTKDIVGKFTESDISILNTFFTVIGDDGKTTTSTWSGNGTYLKNVLKAAEGKIATINGSLFVSTAKTEEAGDVTGFGGTFDGNGYVIEYLNIMGYGKDNVGMFDVIGANGIVKNLHLRNVTINGNAKYVGGIAGKVIAAAEAALDNSVNNVSFHGSINVTGSTDQSVGGLFGISERAVENAIVLGSITVSNVNAKVGGVVGTATAGLNNVVSMMQITASGGTVGAFTSNNAHVGENCTHMTNAVWKKGTSGTGFENVDGKNVGYNDLMSGSVSGYGTTNKYYHESETSVTKGEYDVLDDVVLTKISVDNKENARQSMRLADIVKVYLLMYSLNETQATDSGNLNGANVYAISTSSWLVGTADGTTAKPIAIANKQNVSLLRELRFASFTLKANVSIEIASTFSGAFYGSVTSATNESGTSYGYKITCDKAMFEAYSNDTTAWLSVQ